PLQLLQRPFEVMSAFGGVDHRQLPRTENGQDLSFAPGDLGQGRVARAEALQGLDAAERGPERADRQDRGRVHAVGQHAQSAGASPRQVDLLAQRVPAARPLGLGAQVAAQIERVQGRMRVQVGHRRAGVERRCVEHQCWVTRTVVFICLPVSRSRADMVRMPSMLTSKVISSRALPLGPGLSPLKRKSPSSSLCETWGWSPWKIRIATSVCPSYEVVASIAFAFGIAAFRGKTV